MLVCVVSLEQVTEHCAKTIRAWMKSLEHAQDFSVTAVCWLCIKMKVFWRTVWIKIGTKQPCVYQWFCFVFNHKPRNTELMCWPGSKFRLILTSNFKYQMGGCGHCGLVNDSLKWQVVTFPCIFVKNQSLKLTFMWNGSEKKTRRSLLKEQLETLEVKT